MTWTRSGLAGLAAALLVVLAVRLASSGPGQGAGLQRSLVSAPEDAAGEFPLPEARSAANLAALPADAPELAAAWPSITAGVLRCRVLADADDTPVARVTARAFIQAEPSTPPPGYVDAETDDGGVARFTFSTTTRVWRVYVRPGKGHARANVYPEL